MPRTSVRQRGFTLTELMVVIAIIGILMTVAVMGIRKSRYSGGTQGYAHKLASTCDGARQRAIATQRYQRLDITADEVVWWQASTQGLKTPVGWDHVRTVATPREVQVWALHNTVYITQGVATVTDGAGLAGTIDFSPDGSGEAKTIFIADDDKTRFARVAIYGATGTAYVFEGW